MQQELGFYKQEKCKMGFIESTKSDHEEERSL